MNCPSCGSELPENAKFCGSCGYQMTATATASPGIATPTGGALATTGPVASYDEIASGPLDVTVGELLGEGWELAKANLGLLIGGMVVLGLIYFAASNIPFAGLIIGGPLMAGMNIVALRLVSGKPAAFGNFFDGFKKFMPLFLLGLVSGLLTMLGMLLLVLPGLYLAIAFTFATWLVVDRDEDFWPAMMASMQVVNAHFGKVLVFGLAAMGLAILGAIPCGLGMLVVGPLLTMASAVFYKRLFGIAGGAERIGM